MSAPYPTYDEMDVCRRCEMPVSEDDQVEGLCPDCMESAGLVRCDGCGRAFAKEIARVVKLPHFVREFYCPFCKESK